MTTRTLWIYSNLYSQWQEAKKTARATRVILKYLCELEKGGKKETARMQEPHSPQDFPNMIQTPQKFSGNLRQINQHNTFE